MSTRQADEGLAGVPFKGLNRDFYNAGLPPDAFIVARLQGLVLASSESANTQAARADGFRGELVQLSWPGEDVFSDGEDGGSGRANFAVAESQVLLHHAVETLFRLYLAHKDQPVCPWLEVSRLMSPRAFKDAIEPYAGVLASEESAKVSNVFLGSPSYQAEMDGTEEEWLDRRLAIERLLRHFARMLLSDATLYNAAKHGLVTIAGESSIRIGNFEEHPDNGIHTSGPTLRWIQRETKDGQSEWKMSTAFIPLEANLAWIGMTATLIRSLWTIAKARYVGGGGHAKFAAPSQEQVHALLDLQSKAGMGPIAKTSMSLAWYAIAMSHESSPDS